jgi:AcrR family transcriptional regulator
MKKATDTKREIELAIARIQHGRPTRILVTRRISIAAVAEEAGVSNATIHNRYPDLAEKIRAMANQDYPSRLKEKSGSLKKSEERLQALRQEVQQLKADLAKSQSINLMLYKENEVLRARLEMKLRHTSEPK